MTATPSTALVTVERMKDSTGFAIWTFLEEKLAANVYSANIRLNANSVNIKMNKPSYHHGDLRVALIEEALAQIERGNLEDLSLREVARSVGVSATAVYRHFPSKDDLLKALAQHGLVLLGEQQRKAAAKSSSAEAFAQTGRAYVRFALKHPNLFRLVFIHSPGHMRQDTDGPKGSAAWQLRNNVAKALGPHATREQVFAAVLRAWALVHGLAMLILDGQVDRKAAEALIDRVIVPERSHSK